MLSNQEIEFDIWLDEQNSERIQIAFDRSVKRFDDEYYSMSEVEDYMDDHEFMIIFSQELNHLWLDDCLWNMQRQGLVDFQIDSDGQYQASITSSGIKYMEQYA